MRDVSKEAIEKRVKYLKNKDRYVYYVQRNWFCKDKKAVTGKTAEATLEKAMKFEEQITEAYEDAKPKNNTLREFISYSLILRYDMTTLPTYSKTEAAAKHLFLERESAELDKQVSELTESDVCRILEEISRKNNLANTRIAFDVVTSALQIANDLGKAEFDISKISMDNINREDNTRGFYVMTDEEYQKMLDYYKEKQLCDKLAGADKAVLFAMYTGVTAFDALTVKYTDLHFERRKSEEPDYFVFAKNNIPIPKNCGIWLSSEIKNVTLNAPTKINVEDDLIVALPIEYDKEKSLFLSESGKEISDSQIFRSIQNASNALGLPAGINSVSLQYSYICRAVKHGGNIDAVVKRLKNNPAKERALKVKLKEYLEDPRLEVCKKD